MRFTVEIANEADEQGDFLARIAEHPGLSAFGPTQAEALKEMATVISLIADTPECMERFKETQ